MPLNNFRRILQFLTAKCVTFLRVNPARKLGRNPAAADVSERWESIHSAAHSVNANFFNF